MIVSVVLALVSASVPTPTMRLDPDDRWALVTGLRRQVGGRFILTGLKDGDRSCSQSRVCTSGQELLASAGTAPARTVDDLISRTRVYGERPVAIVSLRGVSALNQYSAKVLFTVFDPDQRRWTEKVAFLTTRPADPEFSQGRRYLTDWKDDAGVVEKKPS